MKKRLSSALLICFLIIVVDSHAQFVVNNNGNQGDSTPGDGICETGTGNGNCTLRAAIEESNTLAGVNTIDFDATFIGQTINIDQPLVINGADGLTINGDIDGDNFPDISIDGGVAGINGIEISSKDNVILRLNLVGFRGPFGSPVTSIQIDGASAVNNKIAGCYLGTNIIGGDGGSLLANDHGISIINGASGNIIGDAAEGYNTIAGSENGGHGIYIDNSDDNEIYANYIGLKESGTDFLINDGAGIYLLNSDGTIIGHLSDRNYISTNRGGGIVIDNSPNTTVVNNYIGLDVTGVLALGNSISGVEIINVSDGTKIGTGIPGEGNLISANSTGIRSSSNVSILGNIIGLNGAGDAALPNSGGITVSIGATNVKIGDGTVEGRNIISGNASYGIYINQGSCQVLGNYIGLHGNGEQVFGNVTGITFFLADGSIIGGVGPGEGNVISGNTTGIIFNRSSTNTLLGNIIGLNAAGNIPRPNAGDGIQLISDSQSNIIGDGTATGANYISGNSGNGIYLDGAIVLDNQIQANFIGNQTDDISPAGNGGNGIFIGGDANTNLISDNTIANNTLNGVEVDGALTNKNLITKNSITNNSLKGISVLNGAQSNVVPPVISNFDASGTVTGTSTFNETIEVYIDGIDEGEFYLGTTVAGGGFWSFNIDLASLPGPGAFITATATDVGSNSSEFSNAVSFEIGGVIASDYNALVALYNATDGPNWTNDLNWLTTAPVSSWFGVSISSSNRVIQVDLNDNNLVGTLPSEIGLLTSVFNFRLKGNSISGTIPIEIGNMSSLRQLQLYQNQLTGSIPVEIGNLNQLTELRLDDNQLTGNIPPEIGDIPNLWLMYLYTNQLGGSLPITSSNFPSLRELDLKRNMLSGTLPSALGDHPIITTLLLSENQFTGAIPPELGNITNLIYLQLHNNQLSGSIPVELGNLSNAQDFILSNNQLTGSIPVELALLSSVTRFRLDRNQLSGLIPVEIGNLSTLTELSLYSNQLSGPIPLELGSLSNLTSFRLFSNQLDGNIPPELGNLSSVLDFRVEDNLLTGSIPPELGNLSAVTDLRLHTNQLSGTIPAELGNLSTLVSLDIYINELSGSIPSELGMLTNLTRLFLFSNQLDGAIPIELGNMTNLISFRFDDNQLSGDIPLEMADMASLTNLVFHNNQLSNLPDFSALSGITQFTIQDNNFEFDDIEPNIGISGFTYTPQGLIPGPGPLNLVEGSMLDISIPVGGSSNQYQWIKDGVDITGQTSDNLIINSLVPLDAGTYSLRITSSIVPGLTLNSEDFVLTISPIGSTPEINVYDGSDNTGTLITNGQSAIIDLGTATQGTNIDKIIAIENIGTVDLNISSIALTSTDFSILSGSPTTISPGSFQTFTIQLNGTNAGTFSDVVTISNNDADESLFSFSISGQITTPNISIFDSDGTNRNIIVNGQSNPIDLGQTPQLLNLDKTFTIENMEASVLNIASITVDDPKFEVINAPNSVPPASSEMFIIRLIATDIGQFTSQVTITSDFSDFIFPVSGEVLPINQALIVYNAVSPNGDGKHDFLEIENAEFFPNNQVQILNRWGAIVFQISGYNNDSNKFDGNGNQGGTGELTAGTYYYNIKPGDGSSDITGYFSLRK